jgi:FixJ family two-component response regulator
LPGLSGLDFQPNWQRNIHIPIVFVTGHGDIPMTVRAMKAGAVEFLTEPFRDRTCWTPFSSVWNEIATGVKPTRLPPR